VQTVIHPTAAAAARALADTIADAIARHPTLVLGLPTGRTPVALYKVLVERHRAGQLDFSRVTVFNVDEFIGLPAGHAASFAAFMQRYLFQHVNLSPDRINLPDGNARDPGAEARRYETAIDAAGGMDIVLLGIGENGHIAFNEPGTSLEATTHLARLQAVTRRANAEHFGGKIDNVPRQGITMGVGTLLRARHVILMATGATKARIVQRALEGPVTTLVPASLLQLHPHAIAVLDRAAAARLRV
jgi:glucosamine-6-phosphate deaminase